MTPNLVCVQMTIYVPTPLTVNKYLTFYLKLQLIDIIFSAIQNWKVLDGGCSKKIRKQYKKMVVMYLCNEWENKNQNVIHFLLILNINETR